MCIRDRIEGPSPTADAAFDAIKQASDAMVRNPNEPLLLQALLLDLTAQ